MDIVAALLDPIRAIIVLAVILAWRSPWAILAAVVVSAVAAESLLTGTQFTRRWGAGIVPGAIASAVQAGLVYLLVWLWRGRQKA